MLLKTSTFFILRLIQRCAKDSGVRSMEAVETKEILLLLKTCIVVVPRVARQEERKVDLSALNGKTINTKAYGPAIRLVCALNVARCRIARKRK